MRPILSELWLIRAGFKISESQVQLRQNLRNFFFGIFDMAPKQKLSEIVCWFQKWYHTWKNSQGQQSKSDFGFCAAYFEISWFLDFWPSKLENLIWIAKQNFLVIKFQVENCGHSFWCDQYFQSYGSFGLDSKFLDHRCNWGKICENFFSRFLIWHRNKSLKKTK